MRSLPGGPVAVAIALLALCGPAWAKPVPAPKCEFTRSLTLPAGFARSIHVRCSNDGAKLELVDRPRHGQLAAVGGHTGWRYTAQRGFVGSDRLTFRARNHAGATPVLAVALHVRKPTKRERDVEYRSRVCGAATPQMSCRAGRGRRTSGGPGTGKVSHRHWPAITGVYLTFPSAGGGRLDGGERADELLGHHGSDTIFGGPGRDVIWGDWDPQNNNQTQHDSLNGGAGTDFIYTSHGHNRVTGGPGGDYIWAFYGRGTIDCGPGIDTVRLRARRSGYKLRGCERRGKF